MNVNFMKTKFFSLLLCTLLVIGIMPTMVFAEEPTGTFTITYKTNTGYVMGSVECEVGKSSNAFVTWGIGKLRSLNSVNL